MKYHLVILSMLLITLSVSGKQTDNKSEEIDTHSFPSDGKEWKSPQFFQDWYQSNDFVHFLDNYSDFVTYQAETTGSFNMPDQLIFSVAGNSHRWNKYYLNGFRIDSRFFAGSTFYQPDLYSNSLSIDYLQSTLRFEQYNYQPFAAISYNIGGLGDISPGTQKLINLFHTTASERVYKPIDCRSKLAGAATARISYDIPLKGELYRQQVYADFGQRRIVAFDQTGINSYYPEDFFKIQLDGQLPIKRHQLFDGTYYLLHFSQRDNLYSEFYYNENETAQHNAYSASLYGKKRNDNLTYTTGLTWATNQVRHHDLEFSRNIIDQDGEAFEPWYPDGLTTEISHALNLEYTLAPWLRLTFDSYNSAIHFSPTQTSFANTIYVQHTTDSTAQSLYAYEWESNAFWSGLLENTLGLKAEKLLTQWLTLQANMDVTFDAMLLKGKSMARPNWQAKVGFQVHPCSWFSMELNLSKSRVTYNIDDIRYFSDDYMNGNIYHWQDQNEDGQLQENEKTAYFTSTGGKYHTAVKYLRQPSYFVFDIPVYFHFGRHAISFLQSYRKYYYNWYTSYNKEADEYGYYVAGEDGQQVFFLNDGEVNYTVGYYPKSYMQSSFLTNTPYYLSSVIKYQYTGKKFMASLSWQSYLMSGISSLGNGPLHNNLGVLSESTANPNTQSNASNSESQYQMVGRLDQDRAYIARILLSYNINRHFAIALTGKFKDGQPFTSFDTQSHTNSDGHTQTAIWNHRTKGINTLDNDFGSRKDAFFNIDLRATFRGLIAGHLLEVQATCYNLYDFGTELTEYTFDVGGRTAMSLNIPRGLILSAKLNLTK